jgi:hypothetical protein
MSRLLFGSSGIFLFGLGIILNFAPQETAAALGMEASAQAATVLQLMAGYAMGWGVTNWMAKGSLFGGIFGRPIGIGNLLQFTSAAFALGRAASHGVVPALTWPLFGICAVFALAFFRTIFFSHPAAVTAAQHG